MQYIFHRFFCSKLAAVTLVLDLDFTTSQVSHYTCIPPIYFMHVHSILTYPGYCILIIIHTKLYYHQNQFITHDLQLSLSCL